MAHRLTIRGKKSFGKRFLPMAKSLLVPPVGRIGRVTCCSRGPNPRRVRDTKSSRGFRGRCVINFFSLGSVKGWVHDRMLTGRDVGAVGAAGGRNRRTGRLGRT